MVVGLTLSYAFKRVVRSWKLFAALLLGVVLASIFFAGTNVGADTAAKQVLDQQLSQVSVDIVVERSSYYAGPGIPEAVGLLSSENATAIAGEISNIDGVSRAEVMSGGFEVIHVSEGNDTVPVPVRIIGISNNSRVYDGWRNGVPSLQENETYVWVDSPEAGKFKVGDVLQINFSISTYERDKEILPKNMTQLTLNLMVGGFAQLDDQAVSIATGHYYTSPSILFVQRNEYPYGDNLLIVSWEKTLSNLIDRIYALSPSYSPIGTQILVYIDRESLISPWDVGESMNRLNAITSQIDNKVLAYNLSARNNLVSILGMYQFTAMIMRFMFVINAIPVFFVAWYMGMTVSDVSFNLRRREIGLLLTKGFSRGQLLRMFLGETFLIGLVAGIVGILLSLSLTPFFIQAVGGEFGGTPVIGPDTIVITLVLASF